MADDPYAVLGVSPDASAEQIKAAYRQAARRSHPDLGGDGTRFRAVKEAWDLLGDPARRAAYDEARAGAFQAPPDEEPDPYLTPSEIAWSLGGAHAPEPVTVRLSIRDCAAVSIRPEKSRGLFWVINEPPEPVMEGNDLVDFLIEPESLDARGIGRHQDTLRFIVDDKVAILRLQLVVAGPSASSTGPRAAGPTAAPPPAPSGSARPDGPFRRHLVLAGLVIGALLLLGLALTTLGSDGTGGSAVAQAKGLFVVQCGGCHKLDDARTRPTEEFGTRAALARDIGPDLDRLAPPRDLTLDAIEHGRDRGEGRMPAHLLRGVDARQVARYVARATEPPPVPPLPQQTAHAYRRGSLRLLVLDHAPDGQLAFVAAHAVAPAGVVTIQSHNDSDMPHDLVVSGPGVHRATPLIVSGKGVDVTMRLRPGRYVYYCSLPGHRAAGERGTLVVQP